MDRRSWSTPTDPDTVARRAAGRRRYNALRRQLAAIRRAEVARLTWELVDHYSARDSLARPAAGLFGWGLQSEIARRLGVHRSTVSRDIRRTLERVNALRPCPSCGRATVPTGVSYQG